MSLQTIQVPAVPSITIYVRHRVDCPRRSDELYRNCKCSKHLRWTYDGRQHRKAAKTRTWSLAEERRRDIEDQFRVADPTKPVEAIAI